MADSAILVTPLPPSIHDEPLIHYPQLISVLARSSARRAVEQRMRSEGVRVSHTPIRIIMEEANAYLREHPELVQQTIERVRNVPRDRTLAKREPRNRRTIRQ